MSQLRLPFELGAVGPREDHVRVRCTGCGRRFSVPAWFAKQGIGLRFCSKACRTRWEDIPAGGSIVPAGRPESRGGNWRLQARRARQRDGFRCQICGVTEEALGRQLDVHHRVPARTYRYASESNQLGNLVTVCPSCHKRLEEQGHKELPLFRGVRHPGQRIGPDDGA